MTRRRMVRWPRCKARVTGFALRHEGKSLPGHHRQDRRRDLPADPSGRLRARRRRNRHRTGHLSGRARRSRLRRRPRDYGFRSSARRALERQIADVAAGRRTFEQLFVNGRRAIRSRTPNQFYHYMRKRVAHCVDPATGQMVAMENRAFLARPEISGPCAGFRPASFMTLRGGLSLLGKLAAPHRLG